MVVCLAVLASGFMHLNRMLVLLISDLPFYILPVNFLLWKRRLGALQVFFPALPETHTPFLSLCFSKSDYIIIFV